MLHSKLLGPLTLLLSKPWIHFSLNSYHQILCDVYILVDMNPILGRHLRCFLELVGFELQSCTFYDMSVFMKGVIADDDNDEELMNGWKMDIDVL